MSIVQYLSSGSGSAGGAISGSAVVSGVPNNVWPDVNEAQRVAGIITYRKTFWKNTDPTLDVAQPVMYVAVEPTNAGLVLGLGIDSVDDADPAQGNMLALTSAEMLYLEADGADTRVVTIYGMSNDGTPVPLVETVVLNGTTPVPTVNTYSKAWAAFAASTNSNTVLIRQGSGGSLRGTIGAGKKGCWLWVDASSKGAGIALPDLAPNQSYGMWRRLTVSPGADPVRPDTLTVRIEEGI
jgi:hypothetical protein